MRFNVFFRLASLGIFLCLLMCLPALAVSHPHGHRAHSSRVHQTSTYVNQYLLSPDYNYKTSTLTDNLWGVWLIQTAYQRDPELQRLTKAMGRLDTETSAMVTGISGVTAAQSITDFSQGNTGTSNILGLIGAMAPLPIVGYRSWRLNHLQHEAKAR